MKSTDGVILALAFFASSFGCTARDKAHPNVSGEAPPYAARSTYEAGSVSAKGVHPRMLDCIQKEVKRLQDVTRVALSKRYEEPTSGIVAKIKRNQPAWETYVRSKCDLYLALNGQRGDLMQRSCVLEETSSQARYVDELIFSSES